MNDDRRPGGRGPARAGRGPAASGSTSRCSGATLASLVNQAQNAFVTGTAPERLGNAHPNIVPYETFETADRPIAVAVGSERQWPRFCEVLGLPELADGPAVREQRRPRRPPRRRCGRSSPRACERGAGRLAGGPRRRRDPVRADQRRRRRVRLGRSPSSRHGRRAGAPGLGRHPPGRRPVQAGGHPGHRSGRRRPRSASRPTRSSASSATRTVRSPSLRTDRGHLSRPSAR